MKDVETDKLTGEGMGTERQTTEGVVPFKCLEKNIGSLVTLFTHQNRMISGSLFGFDDYGNYCLENMKEIGENGTVLAEMDIAIINGSSVVLIDINSRGEKVD